MVLISAEFLKVNEDYMTATIAVPNGQGAVDTHNNTVANLQENVTRTQAKIAELQATLVKIQADLAARLVNPVVLHPVAVTLT